MLSFKKSDFRGRCGGFYYKGVIKTEVELIQEPHESSKDFKGFEMRGWVPAQIGKIKTRVFLQISEVKDGVAFYTACF